MKLSTKARYALVALCDVAMRDTDEVVSLTTLGKQQDISVQYLEQLFRKLKIAGIVGSTRGPAGGYFLARSASEIRLSDVLTAVDETIDAQHVGAAAKGGAGVAGGLGLTLVTAAVAALALTVPVPLHELDDVVLGDREQRQGREDHEAQVGLEAVDRVGVRE